ncbi:MAG TPA: class D beta-lactamase [Noviherbaspirillum sp.]|nr:class D beta-lactamase [Noviherbaspirillum sp.]
MNKLFRIVLAATASFISLGASATEMVDRPDLATHFTSSGVQGTLVLLDTAADRISVHNAGRAQRRFVPASTFKILNSLIALETGAVKDENEILPYGGKPQRFKQWEKDMAMREAIKVSNVPIYQEVARRVGPERMSRFVRLAGYGNADIGDIVDRFWLDGPLAISAIEQAKFVARLARRQLPFSERSQAVVRDIIKQEETATYAMFSKTGWAFADTPANSGSKPAELGWLVGWVEREGKVYAFALNIDIYKDEDAAKRQVIVRKCLQSLGVL